MIRPLGPDGVRQRISELQSRIATLQASQNTSALTASHLSGPIGSSGQTGLQPLRPFGPGLTVQGPGAPPELKSSIHKAAQDNGVDPSLFEALVGVESSYNPRTTSKAGAMGLAQLMPGTAKMLGVADPYNPEQNLMGGARYLAQMLKKFGDVPMALAAYNAGPGAIQRYGGIPPFSETRRYIEKVMTRMSQIAQVDDR